MTKHNGTPWRDMTSAPIHAHGGCMQFHEGYYYWYGGDRRGNYYVSSCRSKNLIAWEFRNHFDNGVSHAAVPRAHRAAPAE